MKDTEYQVKTNKTTPYWNCPTVILKMKYEDISQMIEKINTIPGKYLSYVEATQLTSMLCELRRTIANQIDDRLN